MSDKKRSHPFCWPTWITGLLAGSSRCKYAAWYRAHHHFAKLPDENESSLDTWTKEHNAMVNARAKALVARGFTVGVEEDNSFTVRGKSATLSGKPDIVAVNDEWAIVVDAKSGKVKPEHQWQVKIYLWAMPLVEAALAPLKMRGELQYKEPIGVAPVTVDAIEVETITRMIRMVGAPVAPPASPSAGECRWCNIAACEFRHASSKPREATVDSF